MNADVSLQFMALWASTTDPELRSRLKSFRETIPAMHSQDLASRWCNHPSDWRGELQQRHNGQPPEERHRNRCPL